MVRKLNSLQQESLDKSVALLEQYPNHKTSADKLVTEMEEGYRNPYEIRGIQYQGDIFYSDIDFRVSRLGAFSTDKQREVKNAIYTYVVTLLRMKGYKIQS